jgi:signal transduction histidine kinase
VLAVVSHDLQNPLSAIQVNAQLLAESLPRTPGRDAERTRSQRIVRSVGHMKRLISDLLDSARLESGTIAMVRAPEAPAHLVGEALEGTSPPEGTRVRLESDVEPGLPPCACDRERVLQVLGNLLGNALKYSPPDGRVRLSARRDGAAVRFTVADEGPGVRPEHRVRLFQRYFRAEERGRGAGLGLYIARGIVEAHGGRIWLEPDEQPGARFSFTLPLAQADCAPARSS